MTLAWRPVSELPKGGRILAVQWHQPPEGLNLPGCWSHPIVYRFEESRNAWIARREALNIPIWAYDRFHAIQLPDDLPARPDAKERTPA